MRVSIIAGLAVSLLLSSNSGHAQTVQCFPAEFAIAKVRDAQPKTEVVARHVGAEVAALLAAMEISEPDEDTDADEVTVLRGASETVFLLGSEDGCLVWRGELSWSDYQHAVWKVFGLPV